MPFCPSATRAKNVGITVNCVECEKPHLLFSAKKITEKDRTILRGFLDTIFYTCENEVDDYEIIDEVDSSNINEQDEDSDGTIEPKDSDNEKEDSDNNEEEEYEKKEDSIREIFSRVFVNDSWSCASQVEKPYYSAGIYPDVCIKCGSLDVTRVAKGEQPCCSECSGNSSISKKRLRWKQGGKDKGKRKVV
ncbi:12884_t:CDS:2 [Rhizophagus irregularis]|nr:12884_t:CDS:2 [Rhizophagus irregularis]